MVCVHHRRGDLQKFELSDLRTFPAHVSRESAVQQMTEGNAKEAGANLIRMVNALNEINLINYKEEKASE